MQKIYNLQRLTTQKEKECLKYLDKNLDDSYQIFCKPFFEADNPNFVVLKEGEKVLLIQVVNNQSKLQQIRDSVKQYKENISKIFIPELTEKFKDKTKGFALIQSLYWNNNSLISFKEKTQKEWKLDLQKFLKPNFDGFLDKNIKNKFLEYLKENNIFLEKRDSSIPEYKNFTSKQKELSRSKEGKIQKIKGVAGSGKTLVLAQRVINAQKRTDEKILILAYNKSILSHIKNIIWNLQGFYNYSDFCISNIDGFISSQNRNLLFGIDDILNLEEVKKIFSENKNILPKYKAIFIDEIQDWTTEKIQLIKENFLAEN